MEKRIYQHVQGLLPEIKALIEAGKTQAEIAEQLGLVGNRVIHKLLWRERKKGVERVPKVRGRKPAKTLSEYKYENKRLKMENELLRDFLRLTGRGCGQD